MLLRLFRFALPFVCGGVWLGCACSAVAADAPLDQVVLQLKWRHQFQFAGYYAAVAQGYYREAGLDVELREATPGRDPVEEVLTGRADFGVGNSDLLLLRAEGKPVVVLAAIFQHSPLLLVTRAASGVTDLQGLHDRPIMMIESEKAELFAYFKYEGVDTTRLRVLPHTLRHEEFIEGRVDAMSAYGTDEPYTLRAEGVAFHAFTARSGGIDFYGDNLYALESQLRDHPARVQAFRKASLRGWEYALAHPDEMVNWIFERYPNRHTREHLQFEAAKTIELMHPGVIEVGHMNPGRWRHIADTYAEFGMLPRDFDLEGFLYDPNAQPDLRWVYWALGVLAVVAIGSLGWALPLVRLNRRLRVAKEAAEAANAAKSRYLAFLTHEIRTPIGGLVGLVDVMKMETVSTQQRQQVEIVEQAAQQLLQLVDSVLDHSKLEAGQMELNLERVALPDFMRGLCELFQPAAQAKGLSLSYEFYQGVPPSIMTDAMRLRQILANLISNAIKFTPAGGVSLLVEALPAESSAVGAYRRHRLFFMVSDTGVGIPLEKQSRLFEPFRQADASIASRFGGSGLGLSISLQLAQLLGGQIRLESTPGQGSTFTVDIVVEEPPPAE